MQFMLDTNLCICAIKHRLPDLPAQLRAHEAQGLGTSSIAAGELHFSVAKSGSACNRSALLQFPEPLEVADFDAAAAAVHGPLRTALEAAGAPIGPLDRPIAAHALPRAVALGVTLVSHNLRQLARVPGLKLVSRVSSGE